MNNSDNFLGQFTQALTDATDFPAELAGKARLCLMDFLTCALSTDSFPWVKQAREVALANSACDTAHGAPLIGTNQFVSPQDAAFANAVAGHSLVRDDMHLGSVSHLGVVVVPAVLALAARERVTGRQLLEGIICGYEAGGKLGGMLMDVQTAKKFRPTGLIGAFAAAAAGSRLLGLNAGETSQALGFAANHISGLNEWAHWGSDDMYFHPGIAARNGITAVLLARAGARAAQGALDGQAGLFAALGKSVPGKPALPFSGTATILQVFFKQVPACNYAQTAAQVACQAREQYEPGPAAITRAIVEVPHAAAHYPGCDYAGPFTSILQARMSIHFNVASALLFGDYDDSHYRDFGNQAIASLAENITVKINDALTAAYPGKQGARITLVPDTEAEVTHQLDDLLPAGADEVIMRFQAAAGEMLGAGRAERLLADIRALEQLPDSGFLRELVTTG